MNNITINEAVEIAASWDKAPKTYPGIIYAGLKAGFIKTVKLPLSNIEKKVCDKKKLMEYLNFRQSNYSLSDLSKKFKTSHSVLESHLFKLDIQGERIYGKTYVSKKEYARIEKFYTKRNPPKRKRKKS